MNLQKPKWTRLRHVNTRLLEIIASFNACFSLNEVLKTVFRFIANFVKSKMSLQAFPTFCDLWFFQNLLLLGIDRVLYLI